MSISNLRIRTMTKADLALALEWAQEEGWEPGLDDLEPFFAADPNGFFMASLEGRPIACISAVRYGKTYGFIGYYLCRKAFRNKGYGRTLWNHAIDYLGGRIIGLNGVAEQQANYQNAGFEFAYRNISQSGVSMADTPHDPRLFTINSELVTLVDAYDRKVFPQERTAFLKQWCTPTEQGRHGFASIENGVVKGYGVIRPHQSGFKIGPLFANDPQTAETLFRALASRVKGQTIALDIPETNSHALALAKRHGLSPAFETACMYKGGYPDIGLACIYGVTTLELG